MKENSLNSNVNLKSFNLNVVETICLDGVEVKFTETILPLLQKNDINLAQSQISQLVSLVLTMLQDPLYPSVSKIFDVEEIAIKHVFDSLAPLELVKPLWEGKKTVVDLGTGGGFPCLPLAIALPACRFLAVDSRKKSVDFVARMAETIGLTNLSTFHCRIEDLGRDTSYREKADLVVCRALSAVRTLTEYCLPLIKNGGHAFYYKGPKVEQEIKEADHAFKSFGIRSSDIKLYQMLPPNVPFERNFITILKTKSVSAKFPRKAGLPTSAPL